MILPLTKRVFSTLPIRLLAKLDFEKLTLVRFQSRHFVESRRHCFLFTACLFFWGVAQHFASKTIYFANHGLLASLPVYFNL